MNRPSGAASSLPTESLNALRPAGSAQSGHAPPAPGATLPFQSEPDAASRVLDQLDGLTATLQSAAVAGHRSGNPGPAADSHQDEECLESYLQRYMQQLTGKQKDVSPSSNTEAQLTPPQSESTATEPKTPARQPTQAPEDRLRITAMRELANDSARRAMAERSNSQLVRRTRTSYLVTKLLSLLSITLAICYFSTHSTIALASSTVVFGAAFFFACRFVGFCRKSGRGEEPAAGPTE